MAAFKGFGFTSAAELQEGLRQQFQQQAATGNLDANRLAIARQAAGSLVPPEAVRKANQTEEILTKAFKDSRKISTGDEVEDQINFLKAAQEAAIDADLPEIAIQATEQLSTIRVGQEERNRLKNEADRDEQRFQFELDAANEERMLAAQKVLVDENGDPIMNVDISNQEDVDRLKQELRDNPNARLIGNDSLFEFNAEQLLLQQKLNAEKELATLENIEQGQDIPVTTLNRFFQEASGQMTFAHSLDNMVDILGDNPDAFTAANSVQSGVSKLAAQGRAAARAAGIDISHDRRLQGALDEAGITDARKRASVMDLAYALATSREGGRLTDQDIDRAIETMGFLNNPDPRMIVTVLQDRVTNARESWKSKGQVAGIRTNSRTQTTWEEVDKTYAQTEAKLNALSDSLKGFSQEADTDEAEDVEALTQPTLGDQGLDAGTRTLLFDTVQ